MHEIYRTLQAFMNDRIWLVKIFNQWWLFCDSHMSTKLDIKFQSRVCEFSYVCILEILLWNFVLESLF
jgi:hypothetical protein